MSEPPSPRVEVVPLTDGRYAILEGGRQRMAFAARDGSGTWVFLDGRTYLVASATESRRSASRLVDEGAVAAPMPATVVSVHVTPGQEVAKGGLLIMLEAMKMELPIRSPRDGRVTHVACEVGELVQPGISLVTLE